MFVELWDCLLAYDIGESFITFVCSFYVDFKVLHEELFGDCFDAGLFLVLLCCKIWCWDRPESTAVISRYISFYFLKVCLALFSWIWAWRDVGLSKPITIWPSSSDSTSKLHSSSYKTILNPAGKNLLIVAAWSMMSILERQKLSFGLFSSLS